MKQFHHIDLGLRIQIKNIIKWGMDRQLNIHSSVSTQLVKFAEEAFEFIQAKPNSPERADAIGDMLIVLINAYHVDANDDGRLDEKEVYDIFEEEYDAFHYHRERYPHFDKKDDASYIALFEYIIRETIRGRMSAADAFCLLCEFVETPEFYLERAYNEIKNRNGVFTSNGNFVKEEDL